MRPERGRREGHARRRTQTLRRLTIEALEDRRVLNVSGGLLSGSIDAIGDVDEFQFTAEVGDVVTVSLANTSSGTFIPRANLISPSDNDLGAVHAGFKNTYDLDEAGTYVIQVYDDSLIETGPYAVGLEGLKPASDDGSAITLGSVETQSTTETGEVDEFTFTAGVGDVVTLSLAEAGFGVYRPHAMLYSPSGDEVRLYSASTGSRANFVDSGRKAVSEALGEAGTYVIQVYDDNYTHTGDYSLAFEGLTPASDDAVDILLGQVLSGTIDTGEVDEFTFTGTAGDLLTLSLSEKEHGADTELWTEVYSPSGMKVEKLDGTSGPDEVENGKKVVYELPNETGTYVIQVYDNNYTDTEDYGLALEGLDPTSPDPYSEALSFGAAISAAIDELGDVDEYLFTGNAGDSVTVTLDADTTVDYKPRMALYYSATGEEIAEDSDLVSATLSDAGTYVIQVYDNDYTDIGDYTVALQGQPTVEFASASQSGDEDAGTMTVTAQLSWTSTLDVTVPFTHGGTATEGATEDYAVTSSPLTIPAGSQSAAITITVDDDAVDEPDETVIVAMGPPTGANAGSTTTHTATILDNEATPTVEFTSASQNGAEDVGTMTVTAQLSGLSSQPVTVPFTVGGTATGGATKDYTITASPLTIPAGSQSSPITITVNDDTVDETDETVIVTMGTPTGANAGSTTTHTATILDNEISLAEVESSLYQLQDLDLAAVGKTSYDLVVMDYSADGTEAGEFSAAQIAALKRSPGGQKVVLAYMSIGEAEDYRFYWQNGWTPGNPAWLDNENPNWAGNYKVRYWDPAWQNIIADYVDRVQAAGFDGVYLDIIDAYEYYANQGRATAAQEMVVFVAAIASHARARDPDFYVFAQNAPELATDIPVYLNSVDGIGQEDIYYGYDGDDLPTPSAVTAEMEGYLDVFHNAGKLVLTVDYATTHDRIFDALAKSRAKGYVPSVNVRDLNQIPPFGPNPWHNYATTHNVDGQGEIVPLDVLILINDINKNRSRQLPDLPPPSESPPPYLDVNNDGEITPQDVLNVINYLNNPANGEGEAVAELGQRRTDVDTARSLTNSATKTGEVRAFPGSFGSLPTAAAQRVVSASSEPHEAAQMARPHRATGGQSRVPDRLVADTSLEELDAILPDIVNDIADAWSGGQS